MKNNMRDSKKKQKKTLVFSASKKDYRIDYFRGKGPGGQHRNKKDTAVRITHLETGLFAESTDSRSQADNKIKAFHKLKDKLVDYYCKKEDKERFSNTEVIRTYNECDDRVVDHVTKEKFSFKKTIGKGDMSEIIESKLKKTK